MDVCVDTGSWFLVLNGETRAALGLEITGVTTVACQKASLLAWSLAA
ncbi:MAG: hypothetical protein LBG84_04600 [Treponema sp.]|nr:hypothetical protein [Treponema sp.]